jgi:hypothetical protein
MFAKWYEVNGVKCQGKLEKAAAEMMVEKGITFSRGKAIKTPHGNYTPDFDCGEFYIEVKGSNSWFRALGQASMIKNAKKEEFAQKDNTSQLKMEWTNSNVKPVYVWISVDNIEKDPYFTTITETQHSLETVKGSSEDLFNFLLEKK